MNGIEPIKVLAIFFAFVLVSFVAKFLLIPTLGTLMLNIFQGDMTSIYVAITCSVIASGLAIGKLINLSVNYNPLAHSLIIGGLAGVYKSLHAEMDPLPFFMVFVFALLNFAVIPWGTYVTSKR